MTYSIDVEQPDRDEKGQRICKNCGRALTNLTGLYDTTTCLQRHHEFVKLYREHVRLERRHEELIKDHQKLTKEYLEVKA